MAEPHAGWAQSYEQHTPQLAERLNRATQHLVDRKGIIRDLKAMLPSGAKGQPSVKMIVRSVVGHRANRGTLGRPLVAVYKAGWKEGQRNASRAVAVQKDDRAQPYRPPAPQLTLLPTAPKIHTDINWDGWTPGNVLQAQAGQTLEDLIRQAVGDDQGWATRAASRGSLLASIEDSRLNRLTDAVTQALVDGDSPDMLGKTLSGVLDDPAWADMVATTELARSMTAASLSTYLQANIPTLVWYAADDDRECPLCQENENVGEISIGGDWPNGFPPVHPRCRCSLGPGFGTSDRQFAAGDAEEG